jgi:hypothetical protein
MRRRLGQRFQRPGQEVSVTTGTLTSGGNSLPVRIVRTQDDSDGEQVSISIGGGPASLTWTPKDGARSSAQAATGTERSLIERIVLDSPDQFVLAQTRGASYYTIAQWVKPAEAGNSTSYTGPTWDVVRITEPSRGTAKKPLSDWRIYYINNSTGMIDKILYQEQGETVTVELTGWTTVGGERVPGQIRWLMSGQALMELSFTNVSHGSR